MSELAQNTDIIKYLAGLCKLLQGFTGLNTYIADTEGNEWDGRENKDSEFQKLYPEVFARGLRKGAISTFTLSKGTSYMLFPISIENDLYCGIIAGPFFITDALKKSLPKAYGRNKLFTASKSIPAITEKRTKEIEKLTDALFSGIVPSDNLSNESAYLKTKLYETLRIYKGTSKKTDLSQYHEKEERLLAAIKNGTLIAVNESIIDMAAYLVHLYSTDRKYVKCRYIELVAIMSHTALSSGANPEMVFALNADFLKRLASENNLDKMSFILREAAEAFHDASLSDRDKGNPYIRDALQFIGENYGSRITLKSVADEVSLSQSYFSTLFKDTVGMSFSEYLCRLRVEESKRLLSSRKYSLSDIAIAMGFPDQSYYCKMFKNYTGTTPGQYKG